MKCPYCGSEDIADYVVDQDERGNDLAGLVCLNCDKEITRQSDVYDCLHLTTYRDIDGSLRCEECDRRVFGENN